MVDAKSRIKNLRIKNNLSLEEISRITGIRMETLELYESGERRPRISTISKIVRLVEDYVSSEHTTVKEDLDSLEDVVEECDEMSVDDNTGECDMNRPDYESYVMCVNRLFSRCGELIKSIHDGDPFNNFTLEVSRDIDNLSSSLEFIFSRTSMLSEPFDEQLVAFTVKNTLNTLINSFNAVKTVSDALNRCEERGSIISNLRMDLRQSIHSIRYIVFYINDYFKVESDTMFILERNDGTLYSLNEFHEKRMEEAL